MSYYLPDNPRFPSETPPHARTNLYLLLARKNSPSRSFPLPPQHMVPNTQTNHYAAHHAKVQNHGFSEFSQQIRTFLMVSPWILQVSPAKNTCLTLPRTIH